MDPPTEIFDFVGARDTAPAPVSGGGKIKKPKGRKIRPHGFLSPSPKTTNYVAGFLRRPLC